MERIYKLTYGARIAGARLPIPRYMLDKTTIGAIYEMEIETEGIADPQQAINHLLSQLPKHFPTMKIYWIGISEKTITIQFRGSPILFETLFAMLPLILATIGIVAVLIAVFLIVGGAPLWIILLLGFGLFALFIAPKLPEMLKAIPAPPIRVRV